VVQTSPKVAQTSWQGQGKHPAEKVNNFMWEWGSPGTSFQANHG